MRQLHFVERDATTGQVVLATNDGLERFELEIDQGLREVAQPAASPTPWTAISTSARLTPREIQMRVRAGESAQALAEERNAGLDWVMRFAGPVLAERRRMSDEARRAKARRSTTAGQTVVFGEAVDQRFAAHGLDPVTVLWDAHRREDAQWIVTARWIGGQTERVAEWAFNLAARTVAPVDDLAADLLSDRPIRPIVAPPDPDAPPSLSLAPPLEPGDHPVPGGSDAHVGPVRRAEEVFDQEQFDGADRHAPEPVHEPIEAAEAAALPMTVPDSPATARIPKITDLGAAGRKASDAHKASRPQVPSWDDILLGVRRKPD